MTDDFGSINEGFFEEIMAVLREVEPVPAGTVAAARAAYAWRSVAEAIAYLEFDSAVDDDDLARVRDSGSERRLRFRSDGRVAEISVIDSGRRLVGRLEPPLAGSVQLRHPGSPDVAVQVDSLGQFLFDDLSPGTVRIRALPDDPKAAGFQTEWVTL
jgi:hypothetical protein